MAISLLFFLLQGGFIIFLKKFLQLANRLFEFIFILRNSFRTGLKHLRSILFYKTGTFRYEEIL
jgi:hypothetical protein